MFRILSHPSKARPIAYMRIVVDCIRVEPARAMYPTLQLILLILSDIMNSFDLSTFSIKISSVFP